MLSVASQKKKLEQIMERLVTCGLWDEDLLQAVVDALSEDHNQLPGVIATLDMLDIQERT